MAFVVLIFILTAWEWQAQFKVLLFRKENYCVVALYILLTISSLAWSQVHQNTARLVKLLNDSTHWNVPCYIIIFMDSQVLFVTCDNFWILEREMQTPMKGKIEWYEWEGWGRHRKLFLWQRKVIVWVINLTKQSFIRWDRGDKK